MTTIFKLQLSRFIPVAALFTLLIMSNSGSASEPLTLDRITTADTLTVVLDFDAKQNSETAEAIRDYWTSVRRKEATFLTRDDVGSKTRQAALRGDIVVYGTFEIREHNPVFLAFRGTWLELLEKEAVGYTGDIRTIMTGKNPYSPGFAAIFAATSAQNLGEIHEFYDGSQSLISVVSEVVPGIRTVMLGGPNPHREGWSHGSPT